MKGTVCSLNKRCYEKIQHIRRDWFESFFLIIITYYIILSIE